jgi:plasmid replication initiation protein
VAAKRAAGQLDLFVTVIGDVPLRDDREAMSVPMVSLAKGKRTQPIRWRSSDGEREVTVTASASHGMATIWDLDVVIWAVSQLNKAVDEGRTVSPTLRFQPHDLLKAIRREVGGGDYADLEEALRRLKGTVVETNIRTTGRRRREMFSLLDDWSHVMDEEAGRSLGMTLTLPRWIFEGVKHHEVLAIVPEYFNLTSGIARWLYRLARRHAGKQEAGWRFTMAELHARSGSVQPMKEFARAIRGIVAGPGIPEYRLSLVVGQQGDAVLVMVRDPQKVQVPQRRDLVRIGLEPPACSGDEHGGSPADPHGVSPAKTRGITRQKRSQGTDPAT